MVRGNFVFDDHVSGNFVRKSLEVGANVEKMKAKESFAKEPLGWFCGSPIGAYWWRVLWSRGLM